MKFTDLINEDEQSEYDKIFKRTKTIFNAYRKGRIRTKSGIVFSYELPEEETHISVSGGQGTGPTGFIMSERIKIKEECEKCSEISFGRFGDFIKRKFSTHDVHFAFNVYPEDIEKYNPETINEWVDHKNVDSPDLNAEQLKDLKRAKTVFKALKSGKVKFELTGFGEQILRYEIGDPYYYWDHISPEDIKIELHNITIHTTDPNLYQGYLQKIEYKYSESIRGIIEESVIKSNIRKRFKKLGLDVIGIDYFKIVLDEPQPINENDNEKLLKKARTVYKAYKRGKYKNDNQGQREDALFSYRLSDDPTIQIVQYYIDYKTIGTKVQIKCEIFTKSLNEVANWTKTDRMIKHIVNNFKNHDIDIDIQQWTYNMEPYTKPTEPINEDNDDIKVRLTKKANTIYTVLKKGTLKYYLNGEDNEPAIYTYKLSDGKRVVISGLDEIHIVPDEIKIREENRECSKTSFGGVEKVLKQKFEGFNINLVLHNFYPGDVDTWLDREHPPFDWAQNTQPINENNDKRIKRAKTIYKALKKGLLNKGEHGSIKYLLPDEYEVYVRSVDDMVIIKVGEEESENPIKFFFNDDDGTDDRPTKMGPKYYNTFVDKIWDKFFYNFDIKLIC